MMGAMLKSYWAERSGVDPKNIYSVSIMPCIAKKSEIQRPECNTSSLPDVDAVLTTRECARLIKMFGIDFNDLEDESYDQDLFGDYTGAGVIFGASGGVMEAALRTVKQIQELYENYLGKPGSELAEKLLHTHYSQKERFNILDK